MRSEEGQTAALTVPDKYKTSRDKRSGTAPRLRSIYKVSG